MKPVYFDLTVHNVDRSREFLGSVFGWSFTHMPGTENYYRIQAGDDTEEGINGGIGPASSTEISSGKPLTVVTVQVKDIDSTLQLVADNGGSIVEQKREIQGVGYYATCAEPGGLMIGLIQSF